MLPAYCFWIDGWEITPTTGVGGGPVFSAFQAFIVVGPRVRTETRVDTDGLRDILPASVHKKFWKAVKGPQGARLVSVAQPVCSKTVLRVMRKLARVADIRDLYMGPPCHNKRHPDSAEVGGCTHQEDEQVITLGDCRVVRRWLAKQ